jgi:lysophospholipase L1-like esterase
MSFDGIHPNEEGYKLIAGTLSRDLKPMLGL